MAGWEGTIRGACLGPGLGVKMGLIWGYSGHVQKQASKCGKNRQVLAGFSEMAVLGVKIGVKIGSFWGGFGGPENRSNLRPHFY